MPNEVAPAIRPGGTKEKSLPRSARSASEFILINSRLSHWETTFSCTL
jgi:hypothetical protein